MLCPFLPLPQAPPQQSPRPTLAIAHPLTPSERKAVADGWTALPVKSVSCFLLNFSQQLEIPLAELQPYLHRTLAKIPSLQATAPIGSPTLRLSIELGLGSSSLEQAVERAILAYFSRRMLYEVDRSMLIGLSLQLLSSSLIQSTSDLLAAVEGSDLEISLVCSSTSVLAEAC